MNSAHRNPRVRRGVTFVALAAVLGLAAGLLSQCRMTESVTGLDTKAGNNSNSRSECVQRCNDAYKDGREAEDARWKAAIRACGRDETCQRTENRLHNDRQAALVDAMQACKNSCYNEGSGVGGR